MVFILVREGITVWIPILLVLRNIAPECRFERGVIALYLTAGLWMIRCCEDVVDVYGLAHGLEEFEEKMTSVVR